ncbi:hypothetical protein [Pseudaminobacter soli (ex Zhang et al. 2022)]|uniref:hypothetical protein n=1 Tax=Pseudaminobacter soli (ex Zhang et al. 2022) TaxID=2831468 RepID=UPI003080504F
MTRMRVRRAVPPRANFGPRSRAISEIVKRREGPAEARSQGVSAVMGQRADRAGPTQVGPGVAKAGRVRVSSRAHLVRGVASVKTRPVATSREAPREGRIRESVRKVADSRNAPSVRGHPVISGRANSGRVKIGAKAPSGANAEADFGLKDVVTSKERGVNFGLKVVPDLTMTRGGSVPRGASGLHLAGTKPAPARSSTASVAIGADRQPKRPPASASPSGWRVQELPRAATPRR